MSKKAKQLSVSVLASLTSAIVLSGIIAGLSINIFGKVDMVVATRDIEPYSAEIVAEDFKYVNVSKGDKKLFEEFIQNPNELIGKIPTSKITSGQPVKSSQFVNPQQADDLQNIVSDPENRGIYLPLSVLGGLNGDVKTGGMYDFYLRVTIPKATSTNNDEKESIVVPFQKSYLVTKSVTNDEGNSQVFFEFPKEESEEYILLQEALQKEEIHLIAVMPGSKHNTYDGESLKFTDFFANLTSGKQYLSSFNDTAENTPNIETQNNFNSANEN